MGKGGPGAGGGVGGGGEGGGGKGGRGGEGGRGKGEGGMGGHSAATHSILGSWFFSALNGNDISLFASNRLQPKPKSNLIPC